MRVREEVTAVLGHIITSEGVRPDPKKLDAMVRCPLLVNIKGLQGFLGLTGYYRKFNKGYAQVATPLIDLVRKDKFLWSEQAMGAFVELKKHMRHLRSWHTLILMSLLPLKLMHVKWELGRF